MEQFGNHFQVMCDLNIYAFIDVPLSSPHVGWTFQVS